ncbi:MAG: hypothetical protein PVG87_03060, partial [Desulfobacteraceae bacterium]
EGIFKTTLAVFYGRHMMLKCFGVGSHFSSHPDSKLKVLLANPFNRCIGQSHHGLMPYTPPQPLKTGAFGK